MTSTIHVVGAGLSGLAAAVRLVDTLPPEGARLVLHEAARQAGGRCRSYHDAQLGMRIDNGNHLVLSGNHTVRHFVERIGAGDKLSVPKQARFPFMDLASGERWEIAPNTGPLPWWIFAPSRRVPGTSAGDYLPLARLLKPKAEALLGPILGTSRVRTHLLDPLMIAALNTDPDEASAALAASVTRETLAKGAQACRPMVAREGLAAAFVDPALRFLEARGAEIRFGQRVRALETTGESVASLGFGEESLALGPSDHLVLAVPAWVAADLLPGLTVPDQHRAILNAHYLIPPPPGAPPLMGLVHGTAEWVFAFDAHVSVTVSAADPVIDRPREELAVLLWRDVARAYGLSEEMPDWQIVKEKRATFAATPAQNTRRPTADATGLANLVLAGDWTATGLPATIEGALRSGERAAEIVKARIAE